MCWKVMFRSKRGVVENVQRACEFDDWYCQAVHSNTAREILHTVPEIFHSVPEIFHIVPEIFHIVPEIFRIVPSQFLQFQTPGTVATVSTVSTVSFLGIGGGMVDMWLYGATNWAGRALKRSRDTEPVWAWKTRFGICLVFGIEGHVDLIHGALLPWLFFPGDPPQLHQEHRWCISFITGRNQFADLFILLMISIPPIFLKEFWVGCCGLYYFGYTTALR